MTELVQRSQQRRQMALLDEKRSHEPGPLPGYHQRRLPFLRNPGARITVGRRKESHHAVTRTEGRVDLPDEIRTLRERTAIVLHLKTGVTQSLIDPIAPGSVQACHAQEDSLSTQRTHTYPPTLFVNRPDTDPRAGR